MSKFDNLWKYIKDTKSDSLQMNFEEIERVAGLPIDHSFLTYKKELNNYGYHVKKISLKNKIVYFEKL